MSLIQLGAIATSAFAVAQIYYMTNNTDLTESSGVIGPNFRTVQYGKNKFLENDYLNMADHDLHVHHGLTDNTLGRNIGGVARVGRPFVREHRIGGNI